MGKRAISSQKITAETDQIVSESAAYLIFISTRSYKCTTVSKDTNKPRIVMAPCAGTDLLEY